MSFVSEFFDVYVSQLSRVFDTSYNYLLLSLFCIVLLTCFFKFIVHFRR